MNLVSVIVPVYQAEIYLAQCIDSILNQTYSTFELLLIDDGSTDRSSEICDTYAKKDYRVKVIHKNNEGVARARNTGLDHASGNYFMFVDSDDWIDEHMIEDLIGMANNKNADIVECDFVEWKGERKNEKIDHHGEIYILNNKEEIFYHSFVNEIPYLYKVCWGKLIRRDICSNIRFPDRTISEDAAFCNKILHQCNRVVKYYATYYNYRITPGSIMHSSIKPTVFETLDTVLEMTEMLKADDYSYSKKFWDAVSQHISNCAIDIADQIVWKHLRLSDIEGFDVFYQKCQVIAKQFPVLSEDFRYFVQDWRKWERFRYFKLFMRRVSNKISKMIN